MAQVVRSFKIPITLEKNWKTYTDDYVTGIAKIRLSVLDHNSEGELVGREIKFSVMGGYAHYMIVREEPLQLAFIDVDGGLTLPNDDILKLKLKDVQKTISRLDEINTKYQKLRYPWMTR